MNLEEIEQRRELFFLLLMLADLLEYLPPDKNLLDLQEEFEQKAAHSRDEYRRMNARKRIEQLNKVVLLCEASTLQEARDMLDNQYFKMTKKTFEEVTTDMPCKKKKTNKTNIPNNKKCKALAKNKD